jgi:hypothetical protein
LEKSEIIALIDALCERPLEDGQAEPSAELQAFCREAAKALSQAGDPSADVGPDSIAGIDRHTAALATLLSGSDVEAARRTVAEATLRSAAARLDAESALAFVDALEQSPQTAPADLVEGVLAGDRATGTVLPAREGAGISALWLRIVGGFRPVRPWRMAAACAVLLVASVASWSAFWLQTDPTVGGSAEPTAKTTSQPRSVADAPAPPKPAIAATQPCEPRGQAGDDASAETNAPAAPPTANAPAATDCAPTPGHQFADRPAGDSKALSARRQAEAARQAREAASARAAAAAASKAGAAQASRKPGQGPVHADRSGPMFDSSPAATLSAPPAVPAARPAAPPAIK